MVERHHLFFIDNVIGGSISAARAADGTCVLLAIRRLSMQPKVYDAMCHISKVSPLEGRNSGRTGDASPCFVTDDFRW